MEFEIEERPDAGILAAHHYSDRFISPQRQRFDAELTRPDMIDRAIRIPDQEPLS
ncbi:hypothetical protein A6F68_02339 [Tsuneonella dongtanensis]|uniref:Uncharacterized protein n=1 Tax=Tsuneonella dongtanensis TaxID=692370 RepID=A0A1B2AFG9_9SPHN|nr:hypothetical protein [Tsuneonella dongtanensis]ANY20838.1 hypothetical protein A6F68_02339 [Tsuneonella dongtanensis]